MSELLVWRQGPLAHVWLASNYDKKLSKQQFLNTNIVTSSNLISHRQIEPSSTGNTSQVTITLRLSGQLLLGIVRIYSRKTKYLLDDIHEVLHKLKTSFKYASGASLASSSAVSSSAVNLPPQRTTIANLSRITLQDQISGHDLFYQDDLVLDDTSDRIADAMAQFQQETVGSQQDYDRSIEYPRRASDGENHAAVDALEAADADSNADIDLNLDFDLDMDNSIEVGRDAQASLTDADQSLLGIGGKLLPEADSLDGLPDADFDLDLPLGNTTSDNLNNSDFSGPHEAQTPSQTGAGQHRNTVGVSDAGIVRTAKRRLVVDSSEDMERGVPNEVLRNIQTLQNQGRFSEETLTLRFSPQEKLDLINELAAPIQLKRRKIWNLDEQLRQRCLELSNQEENTAMGDTLADQSADMDLDMDTSLDFDISLPGLDSDDMLDPLQAQAEQHEEYPEDASEDVGPENLRSTIQVAEQLREIFFNNTAVTLDELMERDTAFGEATPLGLPHKSGSGVKVSDRREATRCFFELLVLATHDCVSLEQDAPANGTQIADGLRVRPRDLLMSRFL